MKEGGCQRCGVLPNGRHISYLNIFPEVFHVYLWQMHSVTSMLLDRCIKGGEETSRLGASVIVVLLFKAPLSLSSFRS